MITKTNYPYIFLVFLITNNTSVHGMRQVKPKDLDNVSYETAQLGVFNQALMQGNVAAAEYALTSLRTASSTIVKDLEERLDQFKRQKAQDDKAALIASFDKALTEKHWQEAREIIIRLPKEYEDLKTGLEARWQKARKQAGIIEKRKVDNPLMRTQVLQQDVKVQQELARKLPKRIE